MSNSTLKPATDAKGKKDGEYGPSGNATHGPYTVRCVVKDEQMVSIEIIEGRENMFMTDEQLDTFVKSILDQQSPEVDIITGATIDSGGIIDAIQLAFSRK